MLFGPLQRAAGSVERPLFPTEMDFKATGSGFFLDPGVKKAGYPAKKAGYPANVSRRASADPAAARAALVLPAAGGHPLAIYLARSRGPPHRGAAPSPFFNPLVTRLAAVDAAPPPGPRPAPHGRLATPHRGGYGCRRHRRRPCHRRWTRQTNRPPNRTASSATGKQTRICWSVCSGNRARTERQSVRRIC